MVGGANQFGADTVEAKSLDIGTILHERYPFSVPRYQRSYAWKDDQIDDFLTDLQPLVDDPTRSHFFGGTVAIQHSDHNLARPHSFEVVDGQQRLTTFMILMARLKRSASDLAVRAAVNGNQEVIDGATAFADYTLNQFIEWQNADAPPGHSSTTPRLTVSLADQSEFQLLLNGSNVVATRESHRLLVEADERLGKFLRDQGTATGTLASRLERLKRVRHAATVQSFALFIVSSDRRQAYRLFSALNDRGRSLSDGDLLRSRTLELLQDFHNEQEEVAVIWDEVLSHPASLVDSFLKAFYPSVTGRRAPSALFDKYCETFLPDEPPTTATKAAEVVSFVQRIRTEFDSFAKLVVGEWPYDQPQPQNQRATAWQRERVRRLVRVLKHPLSLPLLLAASQTATEKSFAELVYMLEVFAFRFVNICGAHPSPASARYYKEALAARTDKTAGNAHTWASLRTDLRALLADKAADDKFKQNLAEKLRYSNGSQRGHIRELLTTIEDHRLWLANPTGRPKPSMIQVYDSEQISIEHIYPKSPPAAQKDLALEPLKHTLGNLAFFAPSENSPAGNLPFSVKRVDHYPISAVRMINDLGAIPQWGVAEVAQHETDLLDAAAKVFQI